MAASLSLSRNQIKRLKTLPSSLFHLSVFTPNITLIHSFTCITILSLSLSLGMINEIHKVVPCI